MTGFLIKIRKLELHWFVLLCLLCRIAIGLGVILLVKVSGTTPVMADFGDVGNVFYEFIAIVLLAPLFETFLLQHLPFVWLEKRLRPAYIILLSSLVFSLLHHYNIGYMISAFFVGMLYSGAYYLKREANPFLSVFIIHAGYNGFTFVWNNVYG